VAAKIPEDLKGQHENFFVSFSAAKLHYMDNGGEGSKELRKNFDGFYKILNYASKIFLNL
jgi:hypothetical protein